MQPTIKQFLTEMPQLVSDFIGYQPDREFKPVGRHLVDEYELLGNDGEYSYYINSPNGVRGFVFENYDLEMTAPQDTVVPVAVVDLRASPPPIAPIRQVEWVAVQRKHAKIGIVATWYDLYADAYNGIASDYEHTKGGMMLWKHFIRTGNVWMVDTSEPHPKVSRVSQDVDQSTIWTDSAVSKNIILIYQP